MRSTLPTSSVALVTTRFPSTKLPFVEPRSSTTTPRFVTVASRWRREMSFPASVMSSAPCEDRL